MNLTATITEINQKSDRPEIAEITAAFDKAGIGYAGQMFFKAPLGAFGLGQKVAVTVEPLYEAIMAASEIPNEAEPGLAQEELERTR